MAQTYPVTFENCSTCKTWQGNRTVDLSEKTIHVDSPSSKGTCKNQQGKDKLAFMKCEKWASIS